MTIIHIDGPYPWAIIEGGIIQGRFPTREQAEAMMKSLGGGK